MSLIISNLADATTQTVAVGALGFLTLHASAAGANQAGRGIFVQWDTSEWQYRIGTGGSVIYLRGALSSGGGATSGVGIGAANVAGDLVGTSAFQPIQENDIGVPGTPGDYMHATPAAFISLLTPNPGIYYITLTLQGIETTEYCGLLVTVLPACNLPLYPALSWVPGDLIDLQVNVGTRAVNSAVLSHTSGLKQGDDFILAVVPSLAGTLLTSGITAMSLSLIDRADSPYAPLAFSATLSMGVPTLTEVGGDATHQYYSITGNLRDASIAAWFADLNKRVDAWIAANPTSTAPPPDRTRLPALAQLHLTNADGITTTQNFYFPILADAAVLSTVGSAAPAADTGVDLVWDFATNNIIAQTSAALNLTPADPATSIIYVKEQDDLIVRLRLLKNGSALAPTVTACNLVLKEIEPANQIVISDAFASAGSGDNFSLLLHAKFNGAALAAALSNYEAPAYDATAPEAQSLTTFSALAEIELTYDNPWVGTIGPSTLTRTSKTFRIQIDRDLGEVA